MNVMMLLQMAADAYGDRVAFGRRGEGVTYAGLRARAGRGAELLRERGADRLVYVATNDEAFPIAIFAAAWAGVPVVPLNYRLGEVQLAELLGEQGGDAVVLVDDTSRALVAPAVADGQLLEKTAWLEHTRVGAGDEPEPWADDQAASWNDDQAASWNDDQAASWNDDQAASWNDDPEAVAVVLYTSGTTSRPKAAVLRHRHLTSYVLGSVEFDSAGAGAASLVSVPPYHVAGVANVLSNVYAGRRVVQLADFDPADWLAIAREEEVTHALVVPTMLARIVEELGDAEEAGVDSLQTLAYGGARMPLTVIERALELFPGTDFVNAYGLTETSSTIAVLGPDDHRLAQYVDDAAIKARLTSAGRLLPGIEVQVRDEAGDPLPPGEAGEIFVRGPQVSGEYLEQGSLLDEDGWFATRDRGYVDAEGYLFIEGRADDTIIRGGENIAPAEIEDVLLRHPEVYEAAIVGVPDEEWGQRIAAVVTPCPGADLDLEELQRFCKQRLRSSKTPDTIEVWHQLPRTDTGKLIRRYILDRLTSEQRAD